MDSSLLSCYALPGGRMNVRGIKDTFFLPAEYKDKQIVTAKEVKRYGMVYVHGNPYCGFYPYNNLMNTIDFTKCVGCKGGACQNKVVRPIDNSKPRADFGNYCVELCGAQ